MMKLLIVDDEENARNFNESIVKQYFPEINIVGKASSPIEAIKLINSEIPDIVLCDIEMPGGTGFDVLESTQYTNFEIIFITAYHQYAIKAFRFSAIDYILKPIDITLFKEAVQKAIDRCNLKQSNNRKQFLVESYKEGKNDKIAIYNGNTIEIVNIKDIIRLEADSQYSYVYIKNSETIHTSKGIGEFEEILTNNSFYRIHSSHMINMNEIIRYIKIDGGTVVMSDGSNIEISRRRRDEFLEVLKSYIKF